MPFKSKAQRAWMHANKPEIAKEWEKKTPKGKKLPPKVKEETSNESLGYKLDVAFGLIDEAGSKDPQSTNHPSLGAVKGPTKGASAGRYTRKKKKKPDVGG